MANTYTSITGVSKLLVNDIWVVDSNARVELCQYRLEMDKNPNKASFSKKQYRLSRGHNAVTTTFSALDNSGLEKLVTFPTNTVQPYTTEITEVFWCQIDICIWLAKESISERESDNHHEIDSSSTDWMVDADTNRATFSKPFIMAVKEARLHTTPGLSIWDPIPITCRYKLLLLVKQEILLTILQGHLTGIQAVQQSRD